MATVLGPLVKLQYKPLEKFRIFYKHWKSRFRDRRTGDGWLKISLFDFYHTQIYMGLENNL